LSGVACLRSLRVLAVNTSESDPGEESQKYTDEEEQNIGSGERAPYNPLFHGAQHTPRTQHFDEMPYNRMAAPPYRRRGESVDNRFDDATKRVRVDVPDFHGKLDPHAFQDWITSLEDYFDWFGLAAERKVRFVRMKLKGQAEFGGRVWRNNFIAFANPP
jgi:hypothetical protein